MYPRSHSGPLRQAQPRLQVRLLHGRKIAIHLRHECTSPLTQGNKIRGIAFSLNKLLKEHQLSDTMVMIKDIQKRVEIEDE